MLTIVKGRPWSVAHTVYDSEGGPLSDLSEFESFACQIREKTATKNHKGFFTNSLVVNVNVSTAGSVLTLSLSLNAVNTIQIGDYLIDLVGIFPDGSMEVLLPPEPVVVVNHPTIP